MQISTYVCFYRIPTDLGARNIHIVPGLHGQRIRCRHRRPGMGRRCRRPFVFFLREAGVDTTDGPAGNRHPKGSPFAMVIMVLMVIFYIFKQDSLFLDDMIKSMFFFLGK